MMKNKSAKVRIYPTKNQKEQLARDFGHSRFVYNYYLNKAKESKWNYPEFNRDLTQLKKEKEWLREASARALQSVLRNLDTAFKNFFRKTAKYPTFKSKKQEQSITYADIDVGYNWVKIPKCGKIKAIIPMKIGQPKTITISLTKTGKYFASFSWEEDIPMLPPNDNMIGIDVGITHHTTTSNGEHFALPDGYLKKQRRLRRYQRMLSRRKKGSNRRNKARHLIARTFEKINNTKQDYLHKLTTDIVMNNGFIAVEDLNVKGMMRNKHLAKYIGVNSWYDFKEMLSYKSDWYGRTFVEVNPKNTSRMCSKCGHTEKANRNGELFLCMECQHTEQADINAAKNILYKAVVGTGSADFKPTLPSRKNTGDYSYSGEVSGNFATLCFS